MLALFLRTGGQLPKERHPNRISYRGQELPRRAKKAGLLLDMKPAFWPMNAASSQDEVVRECLVKAGFDPAVADKDMLASAETYGRNLEDAVNTGAFGAPYYVTDDDQCFFWGEQDRLDNLDVYLSGDM